jgi:polar amino acid transport system substrate-binding protein
MRLMHQLLTAEVVVLLVLASGCGSSSGGGVSQSPAATAPTTREQVVGLVDATCAAVENDAAATFAAIAAGEAPYVDATDPALYAFVFDRTVTLVADPDPAFQGRTMRGVPDAAGTCFRDQIVAGAFADGSGWVEYVKEKPGTGGLYRKTSYYRLVTGSDGEQYVVGAGKYLGPWTGTPSASPSPAAAPPSKAEVEAFVDAAWKHARDVGKEQAIADFMDTSGPWVRDGLYVFSNDADGIVLCLPTDPSRIGDDRWDAQDPEGTYFVRQMVRTAMDEGAGWVDYLYTDPAAGYALADKSSYVRRVDDTWYVGAGTYAK